MGEQVAAGLIKKVNLYEIYFKKIPQGILYGGLAQLGEHLPCKQGVESSNLLVSICSVFILNLKTLQDVP